MWLFYLYLFVYKYLFWGVLCLSPHCSAQVSLVVVCGLTCPTACGILVPQPGIEPMSPALEGGFLTTGPPGKSQNNVLLIRKLSEPYLDPDSKKSKGDGGRIELTGEEIWTLLVHDMKELLLICLAVRMVLQLCFFKKGILIFQRYILKYLWIKLPDTLDLLQNNSQLGGSGETQLAMSRQWLERDQGYREPHCSAVCVHAWNVSTVVS